MHRRAIQPSRARGMTMVELMIAVTLGLVISGALLTVYINSSRNFAQDERFARMQENARYALRVLSDDLVMADFWGQVVSTDDVSTALAVPGGDCGVGIAMFDADAGLLFNNYHETPALTQFAPCATVTGNRQGDSDVIAIKRVQGAPTAQSFVDVADTDGDSDTSETITVGDGDLVAGEVYLRSNGTSANLIDDASDSNAPTVGSADWAYVPRIYFVRDHYETVGDGVPALCRLSLDVLNLDELSCVAEGIEDLHLQFGIDTDTDGVANLYTSTPTAADMENAISVRVHVLARSVEPIPFYTDNKSYLLGDEPVPAAGDGFLRSVFSTTLALRNPANRSLFN